MEKHRTYYPVAFPAEILRKAETHLFPDPEKIKCIVRSVQIGNDRWKHDSSEEFYADYKRGTGEFFLHLGSGDKKFTAAAFCPPAVQITVDAPTRGEIEGIFSIFDNAENSAKIEVERPYQPHIFIGHGRSTMWRDLKDHLHDHHGYTIQAYEVGARAGHTVRDILSEMINKSSFALLVLSAEDKISKGSLRARQNVVHELGLFQGALGFSRAIALLEEGAEELSNIQGIHQIRFSKGNIRETFGDVLATIRREFGGP